MILRDYQERAIADVRGHYARGTKRVLLVLATGGGKTATASELIRRSVARGKRALFVVHLREVVRDTARRLRDAGLNTTVLMAGEPFDATAPVVVASVQTIAARGLHPAADLVITDEAHHIAAVTYRAIHAHYPDAWHLGLTATPERADGAGLGDAFDVLVVGATVAELTAGGYLAPCDALVPADAVARGVDALSVGARLARDPVAALAEYAPQGRALVFHRYRTHSEAGAARQGPRAAHVDGSTPKRARDAVLARFCAGELDTVHNVNCLTEGFDAPNADTVVLARSFATTTPYLQACGRVLRVPADRPDKRALILDLAGNVLRHGLPDAPREFSLGKRPLKTKTPAPRLCATCGAVRRGDEPACWRCATAHPVPPPPRYADRELVRLDPGALVAPPTKLRSLTADQYDDLARTAARARRLGLKPGWVAHRFRELHGAWPPWTVLNRLLAEAS